MRVKSLHIYPLKGGPAVDLDSGMLLPHGLRFDRRLMVIDAESGKGLSLKANPRLVGDRVKVVRQKPGYILAPPKV